MNACTNELADLAHTTVGRSVGRAVLSVARNDLITCHVILSIVHQLLFTSTTESIYHSCILASPKRLDWGCILVLASCLL